VVLGPMNDKLLSLHRSVPSAAEMSDEVVIAACATGDLGALGAMFDRFHAAIYRFLGRMSWTDEFARDDLVQATLLEARRVANRFRGRSAGKTWILGIAANLARDHQRGERRRRDKHARYVETLVSVPERPDEQFERHELLRAIDDALSALPPEQRIAFILCDLEEISGVDAARAVGVPQGTLWRRLHIARRALRAALTRGSGVDPAWWTPTLSTSTAFTTPPGATPRSTTSARSNLNCYSP
jgi:RNA polymerase sigma-70 factor (ECF subfamily)